MTTQRHRTRLLALVALALTGLVLVSVQAGAEAGTALTVKKVKKLAGKVADQRISASAETLSVAKAKSADTATHATSASTADNATHANSADTAEEADHAERAEDADTVDGNAVSSFLRQMAMNVPEATVAVLGPVTLKLDCDGGFPNVSVTSTSGLLHWYFVSRISGNVVTDEGGSGSFTSGSVNSLGIPDHGSGTVNYANSTAAITINYSWRSNGSTCTAYGTAIRTTGSSWVL
jgi:hypothetical protein